MKRFLLAVILCLAGTANAGFIPGQVLTAAQLNAALGAVTGLATTTTPVVVSGASAPSVGQVLMATSPTTATWQVNGISWGGITGTLSNQSDLSTALAGKASLAGSSSQAFSALTINGNTITAGSSTFTGTAGQVYTFPTTTATLARTDAANTFAGTQTFSTVSGGNMYMTSLRDSSNIILSGAAAVIASGFGTTPTLTSHNADSFSVTIGTGGAASGILTMPSVATRWNCSATDLTNSATITVVAVGTSTTSVTVTSYSRTTGLATNMLAADVIGFLCMAQ